LEDVEGLEDIETIGAENDSNSAVLRFEGNDSLQNLDGLSGLNTIENGETYIIRNPNLRRIGGLQDITEFPHGLNVSDNAELEDITSLYGTDTIGKSLSIVGNPKLPSCQAQRIANNAMVENGVSIGDNGSGDCMEQ
jgi:acetyltransferase-like isoleucine patch superfamily enzyme